MLGGIRAVQVGFEFGESQFDGIEVRAVGRQIVELSATALNGGGDFRTRPKAWSTAGVFATRRQRN